MVDGLEQQLNREISACSSCPLGAGQSFLSPLLAKNVDTVLLLEAPALRSCEENNPWEATGVPFLGRALQHAAGGDLSRFHVTFVSKCIPRLGGFACLGFGGEVSLTGAIALSHWFGLSDRVIGLTVMAIGTSLPELATSLQAARQGEHEIAVSNVVGSNIFNVFCILGLSGMLVPLVVPEVMLAWDMWWMFGFGLSLLMPILWGRRTITRAMGCFYLLALVFYTGMLLMYPDLGA